MIKLPPIILAMKAKLLDQKRLEAMAGDIASLLRGRLPDRQIEVNVRTDSVYLRSRTVVQVFASSPTGDGIFTVNLEMKNF